MTNIHGDADLINEVETQAWRLHKALLATGDKAFFKVHPQAIEYANEYLQDCGYKLVPINAKQPVKK